MDKRKQVSFNNKVMVLSIPGRSEEEKNTPRQPSLAEILRFATKTMNTIDKNIMDNGGSLPTGDDDVIQRMRIFDHTGPIAKAISDHPSVEYIESNISMGRVKYDDANLQDKISIDFLKAIEDGMSSKHVPCIEGSVRNTLHVLFNPSPDDLVGDMEHCLVLYTTRSRMGRNLPAFSVLMDVYMDV